MKLLVDAGNSRIKWAVDGDNYWLAGVSKRSDFGQAVKDSITNNINIDKVVVSSTRNQIYNQLLSVLVDELFNQAAEFIEPQRRQFGVINRYQPVSSLGSDRWANIVAARSMGNSPAIIIDCGTAITIDALSSDGMFEGGVIFPGIDLALDSLNQADNLSQVRKTDASVFAHNSDQAMYSGVLYSIASGVDGIVRQMRKKLGYSVNIYLSGGDADKIAALLDHNVIKEPELVLKGLKVISDSDS